MCPALASSAPQLAWGASVEHFHFDPVPAPALQSTPPFFAEKKDVKKFDFLLFFNLVSLKHHILKGHCQEKSFQTETVGV